MFGSFRPPRARCEHEGGTPKYAILHEGIERQFFYEHRPKEFRTGDKNKVDVQSMKFAYPSAKQSFKGRVVRFVGEILGFSLF